MSHLTSDYNMDSRALADFLGKLWFFSGFDEAHLQKLSAGALLGFYPKGTVILQQDVSEVDHLMLIERGAARLYRRESEDESTLVDYRGEGGLIGVASILSKSKASHSVETVEDTFCFLINKEQFLEFARNNPIFAENYYRKLSTNLVGQTYSELRAEVINNSLSEDFQLACVSVGEALKRKPEVIDISESIHRAALRMAETEASVVLVNDPDRGIVGILSDRDLRSKVVARRADYDEPVGSIMTDIASSIESSATCLDAVIRMLKADIHHLVVRRGSETLGVITAHDILASQEISPVLLLEEIDRQTEAHSIYELAKKTPRLIRKFVERGAKANDITKIVALINDHLVGKLLVILQDKLGPPPVRFAWMVMGSEGRMEQTLRTDQDNAIVYEDPGPSWESTKTAKLYFRSMGNQITPHLVECGFPLCKGGYMASKTTWRKPYSVWTGYFDEWMSTADQYVMLNAKIFLDFRCGFGSEELVERLRDHVMENIRTNNFFLNHLAKDSLVIKPPLSFLRNFIVERDEEHGNHLDLKMRGLVPIVDFARAMALKHQIRETNTTSRLLALSSTEGIDKEICNDVISAYEFLMHLRLVHQLRMVQHGMEPNNFVNPSELSDLEKQTLKGAFGVINRMQSYMARIRVEI